MQLLASIFLLVLSFLPGQPQPAGLVNASLGLDRPEPHQSIAVQAGPPLALPIKTTATQLGLGASASLAVDLDSGTTLHTQNADTPLPIASITKLVTVMVILASHQTDEVITIPALPAYQPADERLGLAAGQRFYIKDLIQAALIASANDAADALALADSGSMTSFSAKMNSLVRHWGVDQAKFSNASGLSDVDNAASARALGKLAKIALANDLIRTTVTAPKSTIKDLDGRTFALTSTNQLLGNGPRWQGIKTGYTPAAGPSLLGLAMINHHRVVTVVLHSPDRFGESQQLATWVEQNYQWQ